MGVATAGLALVVVPGWRIAMSRSARRDRLPILGRTVCSRTPCRPTTWLW